MTLSVSSVVLCFNVTVKRCFVVRGAGPVRPSVAPRLRSRHGARVVRVGVPTHAADSQLRAARRRPSPAREGAGV